MSSLDLEILNRPAYQTPASKAGREPRLEIPRVHSTSCFKPVNQMVRKMALLILTEVVAAPRLSFKEWPGETSDRLTWTLDWLGLPRLETDNV